jgi:hypothetical protein
VDGRKTKPKTRRAKDKTMAYGNWKYSSRPSNNLPLEARRSKRWREMTEAGTYSKSGYELSPTELTKFMELLNLQMWDLKRLAEDFRLTEKAAQEVLKARADFPDSSLADLYSGISMPMNLKKAHENLDLLVLELLGIDPSASESQILGSLFTLYVETQAQVLL